MNDSLKKDQSCFLKNVFKSLSLVKTRQKGSRDRKKVPGSLTNTDNKRKDALPFANECVYYFFPGEVLTRVL